jgi:DNA-binding MarR family transcriptional regulator
MSMDALIKGEEVIALFCRLYINKKHDLPLRASEMGLLVFVCKSDTPVTSVMASNFFKVKKPMIAAAVSSLTQKGYLEKVPSRTDKRSFTLTPTEQARKFVEETYEEHLKIIELLRRRLGNDYDALIELLEKASNILL